MKWIYIVSWCILTIAPKTVETDKFGRINPSQTDELNYYTHCGNEKKFAFKEDAIKFYEEALSEDGLRRVSIDSCQRMMQIIYGAEAHTERRKPFGLYMVPIQELYLVDRRESVFRGSQLYRPKQAMPLVKVATVVSWDLRT